MEYSSPFHLVLNQACQNCGNIVEVPLREFTPIGENQGVNLELVFRGWKKCSRCGKGAMVEVKSFSCNEVPGWVGDLFATASEPSFHLDREKRVTVQAVFTYPKDVMEGVSGETESGN